LADTFEFIKPEDFEGLGIEEDDIPAGTFAANRHPSQIPSRFGGNAYGFGFFEVYDRIHPRDIELLQSINFQNSEQIKGSYREINRIYKNIGLLKRFSRLGKPYYLIPVHLVSNSISNIKSKSDEISKIVDFHRKKYLKESHNIGILTHADDLIVNDLSLRFKEHQFTVLDSFEKLRSTDATLDLVILPKDINQILFTETFIPRTSSEMSKKRLENYVYYILWKIYNLLKPDGEIFIVANRFALKTNQSIAVTFQTDQEEKNFFLFTHLFKTRRKYQAKSETNRINAFDFQKYLNPPYIEKEVWDRLLEGRHLEDLSLSEINRLPYLNFSLEEELAYDQDKTWSKVLSSFFNKIFLKPLAPDIIREEWAKRFHADGYTPDYMLIYLGQKKPLRTSLSELSEEMMKSQLSGCPLSLLSEYKDTFDYVVRTLEVLKRIKSGRYASLQELFIERLKEPLDNKKKRFGGLNDVMRLMAKVNRLRRIEGYLNPDKIEGGKTRLLENLEALLLFGFSHGELEELFLIVVGHTPMGRILSGKMNEKALQPVSDLAKNFSPPQALNFLRFCRLMSMAETVASKQSDLNQEELAELFDLHESMVKVVTNKDMDWERLSDERISAMGGIHNRIIRKILKMMNLFQFLGNWAELRSKGPMEKEALADYDEDKLRQIGSVLELLSVIDQFEDMYLKEDPLQLSIFYRKLLNLEFHGTVHLFEKINSRLVFLFLWIAVNVTRGDIVNFNNVLSGVSQEDIDAYIKRVEDETDAVNINYLDFGTLARLSGQLYENHTAFIVGTGFQLKVNPENQALEIAYIDLDKAINNLTALTRESEGRKITEIPGDELDQMEKLFADLESFHQSHLKLISQKDQNLRLPGRQKEWFRRTRELMATLRSSFIESIFQPEEVYTDLELLLKHSPCILRFVLPEFMALEDTKLPGQIYLKSTLMNHILGSTRRIQALIRKDREGFQDVQSLHKLAQREFGPMVAGIVGLNESQIETLEGIVANLKKKPELFDALIKSFIFRDIGLISELRDKYEEQLNPADHAYAGALFLELEKIPERYNTGKKARDHLIFLVKHHDLLHHTIRGEFSLYAIQDVVDCRDKDLFDAFFVGSFTMFSSMREDLILEDLARHLFQYRILCHRIIDGRTTPEDHLREIYAFKGHTYYALEDYRRKGLPENVPPARYLESYTWREEKKDDYIQAGKMIYAMERILRLRGIRYVEFPEMVSLMVKVPLKYIYRKRVYVGIGYATFERELFEALRIYNSLQMLPEEVRHFMYEHLVGDEVRIFGFENVSAYLSYENLINLLFTALLGAYMLGPETRRPVCINFFDLVDKIDKRYEAVNDALSRFPTDNPADSLDHLRQLLKSNTGLIFRQDENQRVLNVKFSDQINIPQKTSYMKTISDLEQLKNYYHYSLRALRKNPFYTDDYELELEKAFEERMGEITNLMIDKAKNQMARLKDFQEIHTLVMDLMDRSLDIGFTEEQRHRLKDLYELRKDNLKREKLEEIDNFLGTITEIHELRDYWDSIKWYLQRNRLYSGKEFENLIAKKFDLAVERVLIK